MRAVTYVILALLSGPAYSWECLDYNWPNESVETHIDLASDIFLGRVISGRVDEALPEGDDLLVSVRIGHTFKGSLTGIVALQTGADAPFPSLELGANYIFFLYGNRELDFCGVLVPVGSFDTIEDVIALAEDQHERAPDRLTDALVRLLDHFEL